MLGLIGLGFGGLGSYPDRRATGRNRVVLYRSGFPVSDIEHGKLSGKIGEDHDFARVKPCRAYPWHPLGLHGPTWLTSFTPEFHIQPLWLLSGCRRSSRWLLLAGNSDSRPRPSDCIAHRTRLNNSGHSAIMISGQTISVRCNRHPGKGGFATLRPPAGAAITSWTAP